MSFGIFYLIWLVRMCCEVALRLFVQNNDHLWRRKIVNSQSVKKLQPIQSMGGFQILEHSKNFDALNARGYGSFC